MLEEQNQSRNKTDDPDEVLFMSYVDWVCPLLKCVQFCCKCFCVSSATVHFAYVAQLCATRVMSLISLQ